MELTSYIFGSKFPTQVLLIYSRKGKVNYASLLLTSVYQYSRHTTVNILNLIEQNDSIWMSIENYSLFSAEADSSNFMARTTETLYRMK